MKQTAQEIFKDLLREANADPNIVGFFLSGSRGKGFETPMSDYDVYMIVKDAVAKTYEKKYGAKRRTGIDLMVFPIKDFRKLGSWNSDTRWARSGFTGIDALVDKLHGKIQRLVNEKGSLPKKEQKRFIAAQLDAYLNAFIRSVESHRKRDLVGARLEAAVSIHPLLHALFGLDGRLAPYPDYLAKELSRRPLTKFPMAGKKLLRALLKILATGNIKIQQSLARTVEKTARRSGYRKVFNAWGKRLAHAMYRS